MNVEQQGAAGIGGVGEVRAAFAEIPDQPGIHSAEEQLARLGPGPRAGHVVQNPADLGAGEIGVQHQAGLLTDDFSLAFGTQPVADSGGAAVLPDDGVIHRRAAGPVPDHGGFPLVGDAHGGQLMPLHPGLPEAVAGHMGLGVENLVRAVLHPAGPGIDLGEFFLRHLDHAAPAVEQNGPRTGGALVQSQNIRGGHALPL